MSETQTVPETQTSRGGVGTIEGPEVAHIVTKEDQMVGYVEGREVTALCGHKFIPSRDPESLPRCSSCLSKYFHLMGGTWN